MQSPERLITDQATQTASSDNVSKNSLQSRKLSNQTIDSRSIPNTDNDVTNRKIIENKQDTWSLGRSYRSSKSLGERIPNDFSF